MTPSYFERRIRVKRSDPKSVRIYANTVLAAACAVGFFAAFVYLGGYLSGTAQSPDSPLHMSQEAERDQSAGSRPQTIVKPISCTPLPHVEGKSVTTALVEFPPNALTAAHRHPGSVTAYVIKGSVRSQMEGGAAIIYQAGETWFEAPGALHLLAENASTVEPAEILAMFVADNDCGPLVIAEPH